MEKVPIPSKIIREMVKENVGRLKLIPFPMLFSSWFFFIFLNHVYHIFANLY